MGSADLEARLLDPHSPRRRAIATFSIAAAAAFFLLAFVLYNSGPGTGTDTVVGDPKRVGKCHGEGYGIDCIKYPWTDRMLAWQRSNFHFRTVKNHMSDPSGPMYYKGWYHLFYQHNKDFAHWGNITWGHAVSKDLLNWLHLPVALEPDKWYDISGVWTGSIILVSEDKVVMLYTGGTGTRAQIMNLAWAKDPSDPLLKDWIKYENNPLLLPPPGIGREDFRDPNPIWYNSSDSTYYIAVGSKNDSLSHTGIVLLYTTKDFVNLTRLPYVLHSIDYVGMLECVELYPVATAGPSAQIGLDHLDDKVFQNGHIKHVLKAGLNDEWHDYYAIGTFDPERMLWTPDDASIDVGIGLRYDWGKFYASRTFYDQVNKRRVMWGYVGETDRPYSDEEKGWASVEGIPRTVLFDVKTGSNLLTWPIEEVESLRMTRKDFTDISVDVGSTVELDIGDANQLDIEAEFEIKQDQLEAAIEADIGYNCSTSDGSANRGLLGPFGFLLFANKDLTEQTAAYFYISRGIHGALQTHYCQDELRSTKATDIVTRVVGSRVPVLAGESFSVRILVDRSIIESFAQGGRAVTTSRVYPTEAIYEEARVLLFNNATGATVIAKSVKIWQMNSTVTEYYPL